MSSDNHLAPGKTTYVPSVRVGNWREDLALEEETVKDFISKKESGNLLIQKSSSLLQQVTVPIEISSEKDTLSFGDKIVLYHVDTQRTLSAHIPFGVLHSSYTIQSPCAVTASTSMVPCIRNTFSIESVSKEIEEGETVKFGQPFYLKTQSGPGGDLYLHSDTATFAKDAKYSRQQEVLLVSPVSYFCAWTLLCVAKRDRLELEGESVPANTVVVLNHCKTNQNLSCLSQYSYRTMFGRELEVTAHTHYTKYKTIDLQNQWVVMNRSPNKVIEDAVKSSES